MLRYKLIFKDNLIIMIDTSTPFSSSSDNEPVVFNREDGPYADAFIFGSEATVMLGLDGDAVTDWFSKRTPQERKHLLEQQRLIEERVQKSRELTEVLKASAPELLEGKLPSVLQRRFNESFAGNVDYAIGVNQSDGAATVSEATDVLIGKGGIEMQNFSSFARRFELYDPSTAEDYAETYLQGYYGSKLGRFITVFPVVVSETSLSPHQIVREYGAEAMPPDFLAIKPFGDDTQHVVDARYVCGFIEADSGQFVPNQNFLVASEPNLSASL